MRRNENCKRNSKYSDLQGPALESENLRRLRAILVSSTYEGNEVSGCIDERYGIDERQALRRRVEIYGRALPGHFFILQVASRLAIYMTFDFTLL